MPPPPRVFNFGFRAKILQESYRVGSQAGLLDKIRLTISRAMALNASSATAYFHLPPSRVVGMGAQVTL